MDSRGTSGGVAKAFAGALVARARVHSRWAFSQSARALAPRATRADRRVRRTRVRPARLSLVVADEKRRRSPHAVVRFRKRRGGPRERGERRDARREKRDEKDDPNGHGLFQPKRRRSRVDVERAARFAFRGSGERSVVVGRSDPERAFRGAPEREDVVADARGRPLAVARERGRLAPRRLHRVQQRVHAAGGGLAARHAALPVLAQERAEHVRSRRVREGDANARRRVAGWARGRRRLAFPARVRVSGKTREPAAGRHAAVRHRRVPAGWD